MNQLALIPLVTALFYIILLVLGLLRLEQRGSKLFIYYLGIAAIWSFTSFMVHLNQDAEQTLFWNEALVVFLVWTLVAYYHFSISYTGHRPGRLLIISYAALALLAVFSFTGGVVKYSYVIHGITYYELFPIAKYFLLIAGVGLSIFVILQLIKRYRTSSDPSEKNRSIYLFTGWGMVVAFTLSNYIPSFANYPLDQIGNLLNAIIISYAISRYRLFDITLVARKGIALVVSLFIVIGICIGAILLVMNFFPGTSNTSTALFVSVILILLLAVFRPMLGGVQKIVDRIFYRERYTYRQTLSSFNAKMGHILDLNELANAMLPTLCSALGAKWATLLIQDDNSGNFTTRFKHPTESAPADLVITQDSPILLWLDKNDTPLDLASMSSAPQFQALWEVEREAIVKSGLQMMYPLKSRDRLISILAIGSRLVDRPFAHEDVELVRSMANKAGVIVENALLFSQANTRANTDELTRLYNHRHFHERIDEEIARGSRFGGTFSVILLDIDLFKSFNDIYGHIAGDQVLRKVGQSIAKGIRNIDLAFRYGGEEFALILPEARLDDAYKVAERVRKTIEANPFSKSMPITVSVGVATWPTDGIMKEEVLGRADAALYKAKQTGRNRTCLSSDIIKAGSISLVGSELQSKPTSLSIIYALAATVDAKDSYTYGHSRKVSEYAVAMAEEMKLSDEKVNILRAAGLLHDIGKIGIPDSILNKKAPLNQEEWDLIFTHPDLGVAILKHVIDLVNCLPAIKHHHEHFDGTGYPGGLKTSNIPIEARILSIADACDAMTSPRSYRTAMTIQKALEEIKRCAGTQFDPELVDIFCKVMQQNLPPGRD